MSRNNASSQQMMTLRGHHFLCSLHYQGAGYSTNFTDNFTQHMREVRANRVTYVEISPMADAICQACPSLQADQQRCEYQDSVTRRDRALLDAMGWAAGDVLDLEAAQRDVLARREELMKDVCPGCEWLPRCLEKGPHGIGSPLHRERAYQEEPR